MSEWSRSIVSQLSLHEKCELCGQNGGFFGKVERLGIDGIEPVDNPRGGADYFRSGRPKEGDGDYHPVAFPSDACLAMSWNKTLAEETGESFAMEMRANPSPKGWLFRPGLNIKRSPLCGRNFEYFSEDPVLAGELAGAYIRGLQEHGVAATAKHYICNNQEFERMTTNSILTDRALHEIYGRAFQIAIETSKPASIMSSYNQVNGEWVNSNPQTCDLLRKEYDYQGLVVSDFAAVHRNKVQSHACGMMDLELAPYEIHADELEAAVKDGRVKESQLDASLERLFDLIEAYGNVEPVDIDLDEYHERARKAAADCTVLLQNDGVLPLSATQNNLLVIGALAKDPSYMGGGSGHMNGYKIDTYLDGIRALVPDAAYAAGYELIEDFPPTEPLNQTLVDEALAAAQKADTIIMVAGLGYAYESEGYDRPDLQLPEGQRTLLDGLVGLGKKLILVLSCASTLDITAWVDRLSAVVYNSLGGEAVASATVDVLFGQAEPGGRLAESWPVSEQHTPAYLNFTKAGIDKPDVIYGEDIYVGYRWFEKCAIEPLYPFGHGLSYTTFEIGEPSLSATEITPDEPLEVTVPITNTGSRAGSQVLQLYVGREGASICDQPVKALKAFEKVTLEPGESATVTLRLDRHSFEFYAPSQKKWIVEDGAYRLFVNTSAADTVAEAFVMMTGGDVPFVFTEMTPLAWFVASEKFHEILREEFPPEVDAMMHQETFDWLCLCLPLPFYKVSDPLLGVPMMTEDQAKLVLQRINER